MVNTVMPSKEAKQRKYMKEYHETNKDKISADAASYSKNMIEEDVIKIIMLVI